MYWLKNLLNTKGFNLIKKRIQSDGHLYGNEYTQYLRAKNRSMKYPHIYIYDQDYAIRNSAEDFNGNKEVIFQIEGNIWEGIDQSNWHDIVKNLVRK